MPAISPVRPSRSVLVCGDVEDTREFVAELLREQGHDVMAIADGASVLVALRTVTIDAALIDIALPDMTGYSLARCIRAHPIGQALRLIAVTGYSSRGELAAALEAGFDEYLVKPLLPRGLLDAIDGMPYARSGAGRAA